MDITSITLKGFGTLGDFSCAFVPHAMNIILGHNESGKSTLCEGIMAILYGFSSPSSALARRSWDHRESFQGTLTIENPQGCITFSRSFVDDQVLIVAQEGKNSQVLFNGRARQRGRTEEAQEFRQVLQRLGIPPRNIFESSGVIKQMLLEIKLDEELRRHLSGAGQADYRQALEWLEENYEQITRQSLSGGRDRLSPRLLENQQVLLKALRQESDLARSFQGQWQDLNSQQIAFTTQIQEKTRDKARLLAEEETLDQFYNQMERLQQLQEKAESAQQVTRQIEDLRHTIGYIEQELSAECFVPFHSLSESQRGHLDILLQPQIQQLLHRCQQLSQQEEELEREMNSEKLSLFQNAPEDFSSTLTQLFQQKAALESLNASELSVNDLHPKDDPVPGLLAAGFSVVFALTGFLTGYYLAPWMPMEPLQGGLAFFLLFACLAAFTLFLRGRQKKMKQQANRLALQMQQTSQAAALQHVIDRLQFRIQPFLGNISDPQNLGLVSERWELFQEKRVQLHTLRSERQAIERLDIITLANDHPLLPIMRSTQAEILRERLGQWQEKKNRLQVLSDTITNLDSLGSSSSSDVLQAQIGETLARLDHLERRYPPLKGMREHPEQTLQQKHLQRERIIALQEQIDRISDEVHANQISIAQLLVNRPRHPESIDEDISFSERQVNRLEERASALKLAFEALQEATSEYQHDHLERLTQRTGQYFNEFTSGKYRGITIQKGYLPAVLYQDRDAIAPAYLSAGAGDQLYFALRLAIGDLLTGDSPLPLMLDDTFVNFDSDRLAAVQRILYRIAPQRQVLLFSHQDAYLTWQGNIISLDGLQR